MNLNLNIKLFLKFKIEMFAKHTNYFYLIVFPATKLEPEVKSEKKKDITNGNAFRSILRVILIWVKVN